MLPHSCKTLKTGSSKRRQKERLLFQQRNASSFSRSMRMTMCAIIISMQMSSIFHVKMQPLLWLSRRRKEQAQSCIFCSRKKQSSGRMAEKRDLSHEERRDYPARVKGGVLARTQRYPCCSPDYAGDRGVVLAPLRPPVSYFTSGRCERWVDWQARIARKTFYVKSENPSMRN